MGRRRQPARIKRWNNRPVGKAEWYLFWFDPSVGAERRLKCSALGATSADQRAELVKEYRQRELAEGGEVLKRGGLLAYETLLFNPEVDGRLTAHSEENPECADATVRIAGNGGQCSGCRALLVPAARVGALNRYLADVGEREATRAANPEGRAGLAPSSAKMFRLTIGFFTDWLKATRRQHLTTGGLDGQVLSSFFNHLAKEPTRFGSRVVQRSAATLNAHRRNLRAAINWLADQRPPMFPDVGVFKRALRAVAGDAAPAKAFGPDTVRAFLDAALERENEERLVLVHRERSRIVIPSAANPLPGIEEEFFQRAPSTSATPVSRLFLLLALTGSRLGEALALKWDDVDLERGRLTIRANKTGRLRILPLIGAPEGTVSPGLAAMLRRWKLEAGDRQYVLPHDGLAEPVYPKAPWQATNKLANLPRLGPQMLRQNFISYAASLGVPAAVTAMWTGHSAAVAEKHYRQQVLDRFQGESIEEAMGLTKVIEPLLNPNSHEAATRGRAARKRAR